MTGLLLGMKEKLIVWVETFFQDPPLISSYPRPKGTARGCPNCSNCLKVDIPFYFNAPHCYRHEHVSYIFVCLFIEVLIQVTARWHPEDARSEVLEEAPIFHPTEEVPTT